MDDLEQISRAQLNSALTTGASSLQRSLSSGDSATLLALMESMMRRYPMQDLGETAEEYFLDYEQLALKYSLQRVQEALAALRIDPEQRFFPQPNEVAAEIESQKRRRVGDHMIRSTQAYLRQVDQWRQEHLEYRREMGWD